MVIGAAAEKLAACERNFIFVDTIFFLNTILTQNSSKTNFGRLFPENKRVPTQSMNPEAAFEVLYLNIKSNKMNLAASGVD